MFNYNFKLVDTRDSSRATAILKQRDTFTNVQSIANTIGQPKPKVKTKAEILEEQRIEQERIKNESIARQKEAELIIRMKGEERRAKDKAELERKREEEIRKKEATIQKNLAPQGDYYQDTAEDRAAKLKRIQELQKKRKEEEDLKYKQHLERQKITNS